MHFGFIYILAFFVMPTDRPKRPRQEQCIIHTSEDDSNLVTPKDIDSWKTLLKAADIRNYKPVLEAAKTVEEGAIPTSVMYNRKCRILFTMKQELEKLSSARRDEENTENTMEIQKRITRQAPSNNRTYDQICIFCEKVWKYQKSSKPRDPLIKCCDLRADDSIKKSAIAKGDSRIIGVLSREIVAAEAWYHRSCYRDYTRQEKKSSTSTSAESKASDYNEDNYGDIES